MNLSSLSRIVPHLEARLAQLEGRLRDGDETAWPDALATANTLCTVVSQLPPGVKGKLLTTKEMAARLGISGKTLLKHKAKGTVRPALQCGKFIRWKGDEAMR